MNGPQKKNQEKKIRTRTKRERERERERIVYILAQEHRRRARL